MNIKDKKIVIVDIETSGLYCGDETKNSASILYVDATKIDDACIESSYFSFVACEEQLSSAITTLTGIDNKTLIGAPTCKTVLQQLKDFTEGYTVYARGPGFINGFLSYYSKMYGIKTNYAVEECYDKISSLLNYRYIKGILQLYNIKEEEHESLTYANLLLKINHDRFIEQILDMDIMKL